MTTPFIQIHALTSYPGTLLNRDDAGFAKRMPFGGAVRTRISSQCLKRHWRTHEGLHSLSNLDQPKSLRSRVTFDRYVAAPLIEQGLPEALVRQVTFALKGMLLSGKIGWAELKAADKEMKDKEITLAQTELLHSSQIVVIGEPEVRYLRSLVEEIIEAHREDFANFFEEPDAEKWMLSKDQQKAIDGFFKSNKDLKKNLLGMTLASGLEAALFGRMTTSDILARGDAAIHVAHALTVHAEQSESDYFSAVDDILSLEDGQLGSGHINSTELTSGLYYIYVVVDVALLVSNLEGVEASKWLDADRALAARVVEELIHLISTVSPGAKLGSTAPYAEAQCLLVEAGDAQPRTLANAFQQPVALDGYDRQEGVFKRSVEALASYLGRSNTMYDRHNDTAFATLDHAKDLEDATGSKSQSVKQVAAWASASIQGAS